MLPHELPKQREFRAIHRLTDIRLTHMVDHDSRGQCSKEIPQLRQILRFKVDDDMPAQPGHPGRDLLQLVLGREVDEPLDEVEAHSTHTRLVQRAQLLVRSVALHSRDAARAVAGGPARVDERGVVGAVARRLHDDGARKAEAVAQRKQLRFGGVARCVLALRRVREGGARPEDVAVGVDRACWELEAWFAGFCVPVEPAVGFLEPAARRLAHRRYLGS